MAKQTGLGDDFYIGGYHIGGDIQDVMVHGGPALGDFTDITQSAHARLGLLRDGGLTVTSFMDPAAGMEHAAFSPLPTGDVIAAYLRGTGIGSPVACCVAKQVNYDPTRATDGMLTFKVEGQGDGYGLEWGEQLTAGLRTDTTATNGTAQNDAAATTFGSQAYLQAVALTGSTVTATVQHSPDNSTWSTLVAFAAVTSAPQAQRVTVSGTVNQYLRVITAGTFTSFAFQVSVMRNKTATVF